MAKKANSKGKNKGKKTEKTEKTETKTVNLRGIASMTCDVKALEAAYGNKTLQNVVNDLLLVACLLAKGKPVSAKKAATKTLENYLKFPEDFEIKTK